MATSPVMDWLARRVPLTLLCDLADTDGPDSTAICGAERPADDWIWREGSSAAVLERWSRPERRTRSS